MRLLVTGAHGFVGAHLEPSVRRICGDETEIIRTSRHALANADIETLDIADADAVADALHRHQPTHVLNLAGVAAPAAAGRHPDLAWAVHADGVRRLADAILLHAPETVLVNAGTGLVYGASFRSGHPVTEDTLLDPSDQYGASKAAGDLALGVAARRGLRCLRMRAFNHSGPGQTEDFVIPAFAAQVARIEAELAEPILRTGNLEAARDFVDVRDVCDAYVLGLLRARALERGTIINIASGVSRRISDVLDRLLALSKATIRIEPDPQRMHPSDISVALGDARRAVKLIGWSPRIPFEKTIADVLEDWRCRVRKGDGRNRHGGSQE